MVLVLPVFQDTFLPRMIRRKELSLHGWMKRITALDFQSGTAKILFPSHTKGQCFIRSAVTKDIYHRPSYPALSLFLSQLCQLGFFQLLRPLTQQASVNPKISGSCGTASIFSCNLHNPSWSAALASCKNSEWFKRTTFRALLPLISPQSFPKCDPRGSGSFDWAKIWFSEFFVFLLGGKFENNWSILT